MRNRIKLVMVMWAVLAATLTAAPSAGAAAPVGLPQGPASTLPWYDVDSRTFHFGDTSVPSPVSQHMWGYRLTDSGILIQDSSQRLVHLTARGETRVVVRGNISDWAVRTGTRAGRQVAASVGRGGVKFLEVRRISDGSLVRRTPLRTHVGLHGFHGTRVWFGPAVPELFVTHTFDMVTGRRVSSVVRTRSLYSYVNVRLNVLGVSLDHAVRLRSLIFRAIPSWSRGDFRAMSVSPDGAYVLTADLYDDEFSSDPARLQVRNARTGALVRELPYQYWVNDDFAWEDNDTVILHAEHRPEADVREYVTVRTNMDGSQERIGDGAHGDELSGPGVAFPSRR